MKHTKERENLNRKEIFYIGVAVFILFFIVSIILIVIAIKKEEKTYIQYSDSKNLEYQVTLKENEYYKEPHIEKGNQYIASLIQSINADFKYHFNLQAQYNYNYKIVGVANVVDEKTNKTIYTFSEDLLSEQTGQSDGNLDIEETVNIEFDKYNNLMNQFVNSYDLKNVTCTLNLNLNLGITSTTGQFADKNTNVMSLDIPLAKNTISVDTRYDSLDNNNLIELKQEHTDTTPFVITAFIIFGVDVISFIIFIIYLKKTQTDEEKYNHQINKIINNYDSYISRVEDEFNMQEYQILKVQKFSDLLEIRDTMQLPIIMIERKEQCVTCFVIPTPSNILYFYSIGLEQPALPAGKNIIETRENDEPKV